MARAIPNWLARFNRKMSFHFPWVVPLISDRSVWHNGKQPAFRRQVAGEEWDENEKDWVENVGEKKMAAVFSYDRARESR